MKLHKSLFAAFLVMLMTIFSCSEESVLTANAEREIGSADDSGIKLTVEITAPITRTVRPMITKYTVELQIGNGSTEEESEDNSWNTMISRTLNAHNTSTTFTNISIANYRIVVSGYDKNNKKILEGISNISETDFGSSNLLSQVEVTDYFGESTNNGTGSIIFNLYGLENFNTKNTSITMELTKADSGGNSTGNSNNVTLNYNSETKIFSGTVDNVSSGSYIITCGNNLGVNLVQDPLVNIYAGATTEINWTFNYNKDNVSSDTTLKNIKIPVWKVPVNYNSESSAEVTNCAGYISANALFAKPTFIDAGEYVSSAYDSNNNLWILTKDSSSNYYITNSNSNSKNQLNFNNTAIKLVDFTFTQVDESEKILFLDIDNTCKIYSSSAFALSENKFTDILIYLDMDNLTPTAVTANGNDVYIAASSTTTTTENQSTVGAVSVYKGNLSSNNGNGITFTELKVADDNEKTLGEDLVGRFNNFTIPTCFRVTDMYFDDSALYITAGALCLNVGSDKISSSFGGLFKYTVDNNGNATHTYDTGIAISMVNSKYSDVLSVPRCIVPVENALYIVDSGFCGTADESGEMKVTGKCNRICVFSNRNELNTSNKFTVTDLHDLADFDFSVINTKVYYCGSF